MLREALLITVSQGRCLRGPPPTKRARLDPGGTGKVHKATDTRLDHTVTIKALPEHVTSSTCQTKSPAKHDER